MSRLSIATLFMLISLPAFAQDPRGNIAGRVEDTTGAVIPGAKVRVTSVDTGVAASAKANESGSFSIPFLLSGSYRVTGEMSGFKTYSRAGIEVRVGETVELVIRMEVGGVTESVEVRETTPLLDTARSSLGQVVDRRRILELPVRAGNPLELAMLAPGVLNATDMRLRKAASPDALSKFGVDGNAGAQNEFQIDGISNTAGDKGAGNSRVAFSPPSSAVREFKMETSPYDASYGHSIGAVLNVSTASGTNELHGELRYWLRNGALDAPSFFNNKASQKKPVYQDNRYGAAAGGPLVLPRLFNGKNRTFWYYAWEGNKWGVPMQWTRTVPAAAQREGDFSALLRLPTGSAYQIYDPLTTVAAPGGRFSRSPFPNNILPKSRLDTVGVNLMKFYPLPNQPGTVDGINNFFSSGVNLNNFNTHLVRFDHALSEGHRIFVRTHYDNYSISKNDEFGNGINEIFINRINKGLAVDDVLVLGPALVLNLRYGLTHTQFPQWRSTRGYDLASLGFSPALVALTDKNIAPIPRIGPSGYFYLSNWESPGDGTNSSLTHSLTGSLTAMKGTHSLRLGAEYRAYRSFNNRYPSGVVPDYTFNDTYTRGPLDNSPSAPIGPGLASMLLGVPAGTMQMTASSAMQDQFLGVYFQDDFKLSPKLSLNLGIRYEREIPLTERFDRLAAGFDFTSSNPIEAAARANYAKNVLPELPLSSFHVLGGPQWVNQGGTGRSPLAGEKNNFLPRVGFAWLVRPKMTIRAGYGWYFDSIGINATAPIQTGFTQATPIQASLDNGLTYIATTANPFPRGLTRPPGSSSGLTTNLGQGVTFFDRSLKHPYSQRWSLGMQHLLPGQFLAEGSYVGSRGTRLGVIRQMNNTPASYLSTKPARDQANIDFLSATFPSPFSGIDPIYGARMSRANLLKPYPQFGDISVQESAGYSWYHSAQVRAERRLAQGWTVQMSYTFSKLMEAVEFLNPTDPMPYRTISDSDRPHRLTFSGILEIPVGRGRAFGSALPGLLNEILGGWQLSAVVARQAGSPLSFGDTIFTGDIQNIALPKAERSVDRWFNVDAGFNRISSQQRGTFAIRTAPLRFSGVRSDGQASWDFALLKNFRVRERLTAQIRAETYNAWNHANFALPNTNTVNSSFGRITNTAGDARNWQFALRVTF